MAVTTGVYGSSPIRRRRRTKAEMSQVRGDICVLLVENITADLKLLLQWVVWMWGAAPRAIGHALEVRRW